MLPIYTQVLGKLLPGLESARTGSGRGVTGEHLQVLKPTWRHRFFYTNIHHTDSIHDPLCNRNYRECPQAIVSWDSLSTLPTLTLRQLQKEFAAPGFIFAGFSLLWQNHLTSCTYFREPGVEFALAVQVAVHIGQL